MVVQALEGAPAPSQQLTEGNVKVVSQPSKNSLWQRLFHWFQTPPAGPEKRAMPAGPLTIPSGASPAPPPVDREQLERNLELRLRERLDGRIEQFSERLGARLSEQMEREFSARVADCLAHVSSRDGEERAERSRLRETFGLLEERLQALQLELREERNLQRTLAAELEQERVNGQALLARERERADSLERAREAERAWAERAEGERNQAREEMHAYRRILAAAIANEKYAVELAAGEKRQGRADRQALVEAIQARGAAEGRLAELVRQLAVRTTKPSFSPTRLNRSAVLLALSLLLVSAGLVQFAAAFATFSTTQGSWSGLGLPLALGTGAVALGLCLFAAHRREIRQRIDDEHS